MFAIPTVARAVAITAMIAFSDHAAADDDDWDIRDQVRAANPIVSEAETASVDKPTDCRHFSSKARKFTENGPCIAISGYVRFQIGNTPK